MPSLPLAAHASRLFPHPECGPSWKYLVVKSHGPAQRAMRSLLMELDLKSGFCECRLSVLPTNRPLSTNLVLIPAFLTSFLLKFLDSCFWNVNTFVRLLIWPWAIFSTLHCCPHKIPCHLWLESTILNGCSWAMLVPISPHFGSVDWLTLEASFAQEICPSRSQLKFLWVILLPWSF